MKWILGVVCLTTSLAAVSATFCKSEDDCKEGYCCVALTTSQLMNRGLCLRLTRARRQCSEPESKNDYFGGKYTRYCPCADGLVCEPNRPGITDPERRRKALRCQKPSATTSGPDVTTAGEIVTDGEIVTNPPEVVTDDNVGDETLPPEIVPEETDAPEEVVETDAPEEVVETDAPEEVVETDAPEEPEEVVETDAPEEPEEAGQRGPGGERPREDDPDCEDWTYGC